MKCTPAILTISLLGPLTALAQPTAETRRNAQIESAALGSPESRQGKPTNNVSAGLEELTDGVPAELLGFQTHTVEWSANGPIETPLDNTTGVNSEPRQLAITQFDMLDWMTLDSYSTNHTWGPDKDYANGGQPCVPNPCFWTQGTAVWSDKIYYLKEPTGSTWDINLIDSSYIYGWITENVWFTPRDYKKSTFNTNMPMTPRVARAGYPGEQIFIPRNQTSYTRYIDCVPNGGPSYLGNVIQQIWGPYENVYLGGNMGTVTVVKLSYFQDCSGTKTDTCAGAEVNWYAQHYGWVRWGLYSNNGGGSLTLVHDYRASDVVPGAYPINFPCF